LRECTEATTPTSKPATPTSNTAAEKCKKTADCKREGSVCQKNCRGKACHLVNVQASEGICVRTEVGSGPKLPNSRLLI
jgi:hypothetical protein